VWVFYAFCAAFFAGVTSILAKIGIQNTDSNLATALRTVIIVIFAWIIVWASPMPVNLMDISLKSALFLIFSGLTTGASWLFYFKALQQGDVNIVVPIDKSSTILTMMFAIIILQEPATVLTYFSIILIGLGTYLMIQKQTGKSADSGSKRWLLYALLSAIFAALTAILSKIGIEDVDSNLGTAIRTVFVLFMAWVIVFASKKQSEIKVINAKSWLFIILSALATGLSWLFYFRALQEGKAGIVVPIDKLSIIISIAFSWIVFKERLTIKATIGLVLLVSGTLFLLI